jgi:signal transduction histidine kinase
MHIEFHTLLLGLIVAAVTFSIACLTILRHVPEERGLRDWAVASALYIATGALYLGREPLHLAFTTVVGGALFLTGAVLIYRGLRRLTGYRMDRMHAWMPSAAFFGALLVNIVFEALLGMPEVRVLILSFTCAIAYAACARLFWQASQGRFRAAFIASTILVALGSIIYALRCVTVTLQAFGVLDGPLLTSQPTTIVATQILILLVWLTFMVAIITADRLLHQVSLERQRADAASQAKSQFIANMSHELRTPLNAVLGFAQLGVLESSDNANVQQHIAGYFRDIHDAGERLLEMINDVLDFASMNAGSLAVTNEFLSPRSIAAQVVSRYAPVAAARGLSLHLTEEANVPERIQGDAQRIAQVLDNLLSNALKFTDQGKVQLDLSRQRAILLIRVSDTGIGMTPQQCEALFQPFAQGDESDSRRHGGTGLGLAVTRQLVELMGATLAVRSQPGEGSCFELRLPIRSAEPEPETIAAPRESPDPAPHDPSLNDENQILA